MTCIELFRQRQRIDSIFQLFDEFFKKPTGIEEQAHVARYLCVLVCGLLETGIRSILIQYCSTHSGVSEQTKNYVESQLRLFINPKVGNILNLVACFDPIWREQLETYLIDQYSDHTNSVVNLRHQIAHGQQANVSFGTIKAYYQTIKLVLEKIEQIVSV